MGDHDEAIAFVAQIPDIARGLQKLKQAVDGEVGVHLEAGEAKGILTTIMTLRAEVRDARG